MLSSYLAFNASLTRSSTGRVGSISSRAAVASFSGKPRAIRASRASSGSWLALVVVTSVVP